VQLVTEKPKASGAAPLSQVQVTNPTSAQQQQYYKSSVGRMSEIDNEVFPVEQTEQLPIKQIHENTYHTFDQVTGQGSRADPFRSKKSLMSPSSRFPTEAKSPTQDVARLEPTYEIPYNRGDQSRGLTYFPTQDAQYVSQRSSYLPPVQEVPLNPGDRTLTRLASQDINLPSSSIIGGKYEQDRTPVQYGLPSLSIPSSGHAQPPKYFDNLDEQTQKILEDYRRKIYSTQGSNLNIQSPGAGVPVLGSNTVELQQSWNTNPRSSQVGGTSVPRY